MSKSPRIFPANQEGKNGFRTNREGDCLAHWVERRACANLPLFLVVLDSPESNFAYYLFGIPIIPTCALQAVQTSVRWLGGPAQVSNSMGMRWERERRAIAVGSQNELRSEFRSAGTAHLPEHHFQLGP
jgi:hypothetical protein